MKRMTCLGMALALVLGLAQCKKEQPTPQSEGNVVKITLNVDGGGNNGSRVEVDPPHVTFENGDQILVASGGHYVGTLTRTAGVFSGSVTNPMEGQPLYFYFLGNKADVTALEAGTTTECTVNISDQSEELPVISMGQSTVNYTEGETSYSSRLYNKASLMKFNVTTPSTAAICITGMNNTVTVDFGDPTDSGFEYGMDSEDGGLIKMKGQAGNGEKTYWAIVLPQAALTETGEAYSEDQSYLGTRPTIHAIEANKYYHEGDDVITMTVNIHVWNGNLAALTGSEQEGFATARNGMTVYGTLSANVKVSIADGATVTLNGANINNNSKSGSLNCAGITCLGNATINLYGGSIIHCSSNNYPGIQAGPQGNTLTIQGTGSLDVQGGSNAAGIGGGSGITCGNISLMGGAITACGGQYGAGIGSGQSSTCGNIEIVGGEITATGGEGAAGIGSGSGINTVCGNIYLYGGTINACGGYGAAGIGSGSGGTCGSIEIEGGTITAQGGSNAAGIGSGQNGHCGNVEIEGGSINASGGGEGAGNIGAGEGGECGTVTLHPINGLFSVSSTKQVRFSRGNLLSDGSFAVNQYTYGDYFSASNSYNGPAGWDALTTDEWNYLYQHSTFGFATVNGIHGLIILPNNYNGSSITEYDPQDGSRILWNDNTYSADAWTAMENNGVVFLPAAGYYKTSFPGMGLNNQGDEGCYLSSSGSVYFRFVNKKEDIYVGGTDPWSTSITPNESGNTQEEYSVRLVIPN